MEDQIKQRQKETAEAQERFDQEKAAFDDKKKQEFEDFLQGKKKKSRDEMSLQDLFKDFYSKAKESDPKAYVNSAKSSLNSFSGLLERKRQAASQKKSEEEATKRAEGEQKAEELKQEATQKAQEAAFWSEKAEQKQEEASKAEQEGQKEPQKGWFGRTRENLGQKSQAFSDNMNTSFPTATRVTSKAFGYMREVWQETFPKEKHSSLSRMEKRKEQAKLMKEYEENKEAIDNIQQQIPEWKRGAVVISDKPPEEEKKGLFKRMTGKISSKITKTSSA